MKPTMIKTQTTKPLYELSREEHGAAIDIGGVPHNIRRRADGFSLQCPRGDGDDQPGCLSGRASSAALSPDAQVTVTDTREMTTDDLEVGDTWVHTNDPNCDEWANVLVSEGKYVCFRDDGGVHTFSLDETPRPVTLVDVEFEAEPVRETADPIPLSRMKSQERFSLGGMEAVLGLPYEKCVYEHRGYVIFCDTDAHENDTHLPGEIMVQPVVDVSFDSPDDVSVGDVVIQDGECPGIYLGDNKMLGFDGVTHEMNAHTFDTAPARLTSVTWTPRDEVTR